MIVSNQREFDFALKNKVQHYSFAPGNYLLRREILPLDVSHQIWHCQRGVIFLAVNSGTVLKGENFKFWGDQTAFYVNKIEILFQLDGQSEVKGICYFDYNQGKKNISAKELLN